MSNVIEMNIKNIDETYSWRDCSAGNSFVRENYGVKIKQNSNQPQGEK